MGWEQGCRRGCGGQEVQLRIIVQVPVDVYTRIGLAWAGIARQTPIGSAGVETAATKVIIVEPGDVIDIKRWEFAEEHCYGLGCWSERLTWMQVSEA